eukprot:2024049-Pyramimonas_sp.AAC.1
MLGEVCRTKVAIETGFSFACWNNQSSANSRATVMRKLAGLSTVAVMGTSPFTPGGNPAR